MQVGDSSNDEAQRRDWRVSAVLLAVWLVAVSTLAMRDTGIPLSMLAIATVFFVFLIPAMNDLVGVIDRRFRGGNSEEES